MAVATVSRLRVCVAYSPRAGQVVEVSLELPDGTTVGQAVTASGLPERYPDQVDLRQPLVGIWGRRCALDARLHDCDRVEWYRPLVVDPKEARRLRYRSQRDKRAGTAGRGA